MPRKWLRKDSLELPDIECVQIELLLCNKKLLIGTYYRPPNSLPAVLSSIEDSIGLALDTNVHNIFITGDISANRSARKIDDICLQYNLNQLITDPTHFTETSNSIIDLFLTSNKNDVLLSGVGEPFLEQNIRYHCPI